MSLAAGKDLSAIAYVRVVPVRQVLDKLVAAGELSSSDDCLIVDHAEPRNVFGDGAGEQFDVLGKVTEVLS